MKLSAIIAPLIAAKVPGNVILDTIIAFENEADVAIERRRAADRNRQAKLRNSRAMSRDSRYVTVTNSDTVSPKKETSPEPPKEKTTPSNSEDKSSSLFCPEPEKSAPDAVIGLPTVSDGDHPIFEADIAEWKAAYPAVDIRQQLAAMRQWLISNPTKRKTKRGMRKFVNAWLDRRQNAGGSHSPPPYATAPPRKASAFDAYDDIARLKGWIDEPESLPRNDQDAERFSAAGDSRSSGTVVDLRRGSGRSF
ncbi:MAG: hypothetical protein M9944_12855 [Rhizobiaceae bacterium]|nr:hypothetical protein [Rhizobiaceae bacterium]